MASSKKSYLIRVDAETLAAIEKWAADEFRSVNGQIEWILTEALQRASRRPRYRTDSVEWGGIGF